MRNIKIESKRKLMLGSGWLRGDYIRVLQNKFWLAGSESQFNSITELKDTFVGGVFPVKGLNEGVGYNSNVVKGSGTFKDGGSHDSSESIRSVSLGSRGSRKHLLVLNRSPHGNKKHRDEFLSQPKVLSHVIRVSESSGKTLNGHGHGKDLMGGVGQNPKASGKVGVMFCLGSVCNGDSVKYRVRVGG